MLASSCLTSREEYELLERRAYDWDQDGFDRLKLGGDDCNDKRADVNPDAVEDECDGVDEDCDGLVDEGVKVVWYIDQDRDGYGYTDKGVGFCDPPGEGWTLYNGDCDDTNPGVHPLAEEVCGDGLDNDCDDEPTDCGLPHEAVLEAAGFQLVGQDRAGAAGSDVGELLGADGVQQFLTVVAPPEGRVFLVSTPVQRDMALDNEGSSLVMDLEDLRDGFVLDSFVQVGDVTGDANADHAAGLLNAESGEVVVLLLDRVGSEPLSANYYPSLSVVDEAYSGVVGIRGVYVGDVSGDGQEDLLLSSAYGEQVARLYHGPVDIRNFQVDLGDFELFRRDDGDLAGATADGGADLNGDGVGDLIFGGFNAAGGEGRAYVHFGSQDRYIYIEDVSSVLVPPEGHSMFGAVVELGDLDADGYGDVVVSSVVDAGDGPTGVLYVLEGPIGEGRPAFEPIATVLAPSAEEALIGFSADSGFLDDDPREDLVVGSPIAGVPPYGEAVGAVHVYLGPLEGTLTPDEAYGSFYGGANDDLAGFDVRIVDDATGDGFPDILVGVPGDDAGGTDAGAAYLIPFSTL